MPKINFFVPVSGKPRTLELAQLDCPVPEIDSKIEINGQSYAVAKVDRSYNRSRDTVDSQPRFLPSQETATDAQDHRSALCSQTKLKESMQSYIEKRLENLIGEHANGQTAIRNLEAQLTAMRETVTRINGAITLCQEALRDASKEEPQTTPGARQVVPVKSCSGTQAGHNLTRCVLVEGHNGDCKF